MNANQEQILVIANQLANAGKTPSVALIKAKLAHAIPLPEIISTLKSWQHDPEFTVLSKTTINKETAKVEQRLSQPDLNQIQELIAEAVKPLQQQIKALQDEVKQCRLEKSEKEQ